MALPFFRVDPIAEADPLSRAVVFLEMIGLNVGTQKEVILATGTGAIWQDKHLLYLVTAWHNLSGKNPENGKSIKEGGYLPRKVRISGFHFKHTQNLRIGDNDPDQNAPAYWTHPLGRKMDVAILPLIGAPACPIPLFQNMGPAQQVYVAEPVFVIGYPLGLVNWANPDTPLPVWKIGNIASDPGPDFAGKKSFLIDATTLPGMSGAPVIRRYNYAGNPAHQFLGIYVGRYVVPSANPDAPTAYGNEDAKVTSALGWVVKPEVAYEILKTGKPSEDVAL